MLFLEGYISICNHFDTSRHFPRTNHNISNNTSLTQNIFSPLMAYQVLITISSVYDPSFAWTIRAIKSSRWFIHEENFWEEDIYVIFYPFLCVFLSMKALSPVSQMADIFQKTTLISSGDSFVFSNALKNWSNLGD